MKILVIASNGRVGSLVVKEALAKDLDVTGLGRGTNKSTAKKYIQKDALELTKKDLEGYDVIVDAVGGWTEDTISNIPTVMIHLADLLCDTTTKLYVVGGAGSLFVDKERTTTVDMGASFPESWKPLSASHGKGLSYLRSKDSLNWIYVSPACNFVADGAKSGEYQIGGEELILNAKGQSEISYADYALAMVDVIISDKYNKERISINSK